MNNFIILFIITFLFPFTANAQNINYNYDNAGRLIKVSYPNQKEVQYVYDKDGNRIQEVTSEIITSTKPKESTQQDVKIFPNPSNGIFTTQISSTINQPITIEIYSLSGQIVNTYTANVQIGIYDINIKVNPIASGTYIVKVISKTLNTSQKVIIVSE